MDAQTGIVLGCPRSGTTYLLRVLTAVPDFECVNGTLLPTAIPHVVNQDLDPSVYDALAVGFERALDAYLHSGRYHSRTAALRKWIRAPSGLGDLMNVIRGQRDLPHRLIYKEPFLSLAPEFVFDALPEAKVVHIVRDGRDCANSLVQTYDVLTDEKLTELKATEARIGRKFDHRYVPWWVDEGQEQTFINSSPYVRAIWMWKYMVQNCHSFFSRPEIQESDQVLQIRYEDFMHEPTKFGTAVLEHFGATLNGTVQRRLEQAHTQSIGKYTSRPPDEIQRAEKIAEEELDAYGYGVHNDKNTQNKPQTA